MGEDVNNYEEIIFDDEDDYEEGAGDDGNAYSSGPEAGNEGYESSSSDEFLEVPMNDITICRRKQLCDYSLYSLETLMSFWAIFTCKSARHPLPLTSIIIMSFGEDVNNCEEIIFDNKDNFYGRTGIDNKASSNS